MDLEAPYGLILDDVATLVAQLYESLQGEELRQVDLARRLLILVPAMVNVLLNYKICAEHGLPFHPTVYYELAEARRYRFPHSIVEVESANRLYRASIDLAKGAYALDPLLPQKLASFREGLPAEILAFVYTSTMDRYTWRATEPAKIRGLADLILKEGHPDILVAAAHGAIMPGLILANFLDLPLYFIRFSMFKRKDESPIVSLQDEAWLAGWARGYAIVFDEDVAGGTTLSRFMERIAPLFDRTKSACVIRHAGASIRPDFVGRHWYE